VQADILGNFISYLRMAIQAQTRLNGLQRLVTPAAILFKFGVRMVPFEHNPIFLQTQGLRIHGLSAQQARVKSKPAVPPQFNPQGEE
jgi:hypothetical protein